MGHALQSRLHFAAFWRRFGEEPAVGGRGRDGAGFGLDRLAKVW